MTYRNLKLRPLKVLLKQALHSRTLKRAALGLGAFAPAFAFANPTGGVVVAGQAGITAPDANHTLINQATQNAIINWQQFSIGSNQFVQFIQPDSSAVVLNRVVGGDPSQILGNLSANGQVFLVNPNGVFFGQGASLDVQGLVATTFDIQDSDFLAGNYVFAKGEGAPDAGVVNQGTLTANNGYLVLAGDYANNDGVIAAQTGQVVLASGKQMALTLANDSLVSFVVDQATLAQYAGVSNTGSIEADGGTVLMTAKVANALTATAVNNSGLITAHSIEDHNGTIILAAQGGDIDESGTLDASGDVDGVAGGNVVIRGNGHTEIASTASINAAGNNANGGFVELSGHHLSVRGEVNLGHGGSLLIDPLHLFITADSSAGGSITSGDYVGAQFIQTQLNLNNDVVLVAASNISAGNPNGVASGPATSINAIGAGNLTLKIGSLAMHTAGASPSDTLTGLISPHCNQGVCTPFSGTPSTGTFFAFTPGNGTINLSGVTISIAGAFTANAGSGDVTLGAVTAQQVSVTAGSITTGNLDATGAAVSQGITLNASHGSYGGPANITTGTLTTTAGNITITQKHFGTTGFAGNSGGNVTASSISAAGALTITATEGSSASSTGGNITLTGLTKAKSITISATAKNGADISAQSLHATGLVSTDNVSLTANANGGSNSSGGNINVSAGIIADHGGVMLNATGGLDAGGAISVSGNISAAGLVSVNATNVGSCCGSVSLANVTGSGIQITANATGAAASVSLGALNATGSSSGITVFLNGGTQPGTLQINGVVKSSHGSVTLDVGAGHLKLGASSAAVYDISAAQNVSLAGHDVFVGNVTAGASGSVVIDAAQSSLLSSNAFIKVASGKVLKGRNIAIGLDNSSNLARGGSISVGDVVATGTSSPYGIVIAGQGGSAQSASQVVNITTGNLTAAAGRINLSDDAGGGALTVNGIIQTAGTVGIFQSGGTAARTLALGVVTGKNITITATEPDPNVTVGALTATGAASTDNVSINLQDFSSAGVVAGFIHVNGAIKSSHGSVILNADGTSLALGASSAAANDIIAAKGVFLNGHDMLLGGISAGGPVNINAKANLPLGAASIAVASGKTIKGKSVYVAINHSSSAAAGGSISVGNVVATGSGGSGSITIGAMNVGHPVNVTTGNLTANTGGINLLGLNGGGSVTVNGAIQTGGVVNMQLSGVGSGQTLGGITVSGAISAGKQVNVFEQGNFTGTNTLNLGNVTAGSDVNVNVTRQNAGSAALTVGNINANTIKINETATSASPATLTLGSLSAINAAGQALVHVFAKGKNDVITTGAITAQGKVANYAGSSSGGSNSFVVSKRTGAAVELFGSGSGSDTITVNGAINIAAQAGNYTVSNTGSHAMTGSGSTGQALLNLFDATPNQGSIKITGNVNMTGAGGVDASLIAGKVTVGGTVTLTAAPVQGKQTLVNTAGGNNLTSSMSATQIGEALFFVRAGSAAGLSASIAGAINVTGPAADVAIKGGNIKLGSVTVTGQGVKQTRSVTGTSQGAAVSFSSSRSAGFGVLTAHATGPASTATVTIGGDVNVSGIGAADINVTGDKISTRNLTVSQAAGHYTAQGSLPGGSGASFSFGGYFHNGLFPLQQGTLDGGMALVSLQARGLSPCSCSNASFAQNVTVNGNITVAAVGDGLVQLAGSTVSVTGSISGTATRATVVNGKSQYTYTDSSSKTWNVAHTLSGSGGRMEVDIRGKQPAGGNSDNNYSGTATLGGNVTLTGPNVDFEVKSGNVTVHDVTATGSGENLSVQDVYTPAGTTGTAFTFARSGTLTANVIELSAASGTGQVTAGALSVQGPLFAAIHVSAGTVTVGNLGVLASSDTVTLLDTRISTTPLTFSAGDAAIAISTVSSAGTNVTFGAATINGNITLQAARDAHLLLDGNVSGNLEVTAGRNIDNTLPTSIQRFLNDDVHSGASSGSANLPALNLSASALDLNAVGDVNLSGGNISVGAGVSSVTGDHALTNALGLGSLDPSLFISAGGTLSLPTVNFTGNYALIEANSITQFASVTAQPGSLVQLTPLDNTRTVGINAIGGGGQQTEFTGADLSLFNVGTLAIGSSTLTGTMTVGANGAVNLGSTNLVLADQTAIQGSGALSAAALTLLEGATTDVNLITNTGVISVGTGHDISIDNSAYTTGITTFTLATTPYNSVSLLAGGGMSITGLLTAASITASGGAGAVNLLTDTAALNIASGTDVVLDNSAETAATVLTFGAGTLGNVSAIFGGTATLGSGLNATSLILSAPGALDLGTGNLVLSGAATLIGAGITGTGLLTAGSITAGGGIGAVNLKTETTALIVASGTDITLDNSAETGAAFVGFASGSYGNVALNFSGDGVLGTNLNAGEFAMVSNNGSLDLSGQALALTTSLQLIAKQDIILTGVGIVVPIMTAVAGGDIHDGGTTGSISVDGLTMTATGNILMPLTQFNLGGGVVPGVNGDAGLLAVLSPLGLAPTSSNPNALLVAGGQLQLGGINFTGSYLYMQAAGVNVLGPVTTAPGALIQFAPPAVGDAVGIENLPATTADINLSNQQFLGQFPAVTLAIGNSDQSGNVDIGANGTIVLPDGTNFLVLTTGTVTGLENISSTGLVKNLLGTLTYTPTTGDIDPSASSTSSNTTSSDDDKKKKESDTEDTGTQQSSDTTAVTHDDSPASVCHG